MLAAAATAQAAVAFVSFGLPAIGPELSRSFELSLAELGAVLTAGVFGAGLALIVAGMAIDRFGTRIPILVGTALGAAGLGVAATAGSTAVLVVALVVFGVGSAAVPIAGAGALFHAYPPKRRAWALGVRQMSVPLGGTAAAVVMPALEEYGGVGLTLGVAAVAVAATGLLFAYVAAEPPAAARIRVHKPLRSIWRTPGMQRLLVVAAFYIVVLQAVLAFTVPAALAAGLTAFAASATFFAVNVTAMVSRIVWGRVADGAGGSRRARTLVEVGIVCGPGGPALHARAARRRSGRDSRCRAVRLRRSRLERSGVCQRGRARGSRAGRAICRSGGDRRLPDLRRLDAAPRSARIPCRLGRVLGRNGGPCCRRCSRCREPFEGGCALTPAASTDHGVSRHREWSHETDDCMFAAVAYASTRAGHRIDRSSRAESS